MRPDELGAVRYVRSDIADLPAVEHLLTEERITHVVHLAAMLLPLAAADPPRGALVNVVGTVNVFEAGKRRGLPGLSYASSAAVYDRADGVRVAEDVDGHPSSPLRRTQAGQRGDRSRVLPQRRNPKRRSATPRRPRTG